MSVFLAQQLALYHNYDVHVEACPFEQCIELQYQAAIQNPADMPTDHIDYLELRTATPAGASMQQPASSSFLLWLQAFSASATHITLRLLHGISNKAANKLSYCTPDIGVHCLWHISSITDIPSAAVIHAI